MFKMKKNQKGFTLVEVLLVVVILGILAAVALPRFLTTRDKSQERACQSNLSALNAAIEEYRFLDADAAWPDSIDDVITEDRFPDGPPKCPKSGVYSINNNNNRAECDIHKSLAEWVST